VAVALPRAFVEFILLGPINDRRQLQDSPILGDVWLAFASHPNEPQDLLITPEMEQAASNVAVAIYESIKRPDERGTADVSSLHGIVAASLYFDEVLRFLMPMTFWWHEPRIQNQFKTFQSQTGDPVRVNRIVVAILEAARKWNTKEFENVLAEELLPAFDRYLALTGLILWAGNQPKPMEGGRPDEAFTSAIAKVEEEQIRILILQMLETVKEAGSKEKLIYQISLNRIAYPALDRSIPSVKADAARTLFNVSCKKIAWAVIDSGIQGSHYAFKDADGVPRVRRSFDFSNIRKIVSLDNLKKATCKSRVTELLRRNLLKPPDEAKGIDLLTELARDAKAGRPIHWDLVTQFVEIKPETRPPSDHGTHVAGIIAASKQAAAKEPGCNLEDCKDGVCPDIQLYDFRVLAPGIKETEFAIIAAIQYIRYLNARKEYTTIHGANLSLSIPHDVRNYACGRTPICLECERLVDSGVVVVAAAGNLGYQSFTTREGSYEGYAAFSVTDPGNGEAAITVGATHRWAPHTYGVSFFSSRGPTGDGRPKPDLVAPGERIRGPFRDGWGDLDGTSMAAPHVSGAAAMLMARYEELIGQPRRIKQILCDSATDLGRERSFQGYGMLDVLRAFQSI
jgi:serine protease AprX